MNWREKRELKNRARPPVERWREGLPAELANEHLADLLSAFATRSPEAHGRTARPVVEVFGQRYALGGSVFDGALYELSDRGRQVLSIARGVLYRIDSKYQRSPVGSFMAGDARFVLPWKERRDGQGDRSG